MDIEWLKGNLLKSVKQHGHFKKMLASVLERAGFESAFTFSMLGKSNEFLLHCIESKINTLESAWPRISSTKQNQLCSAKSHFIERKIIKY